MSKKRAAISADIISSTSLTIYEIATLQKMIRETFKLLEKQLQDKSELFWGRVVKGDTIECVFESPRYALRSALLLKSAILLVPSTWDALRDEEQIQKGFEYFLSYGIRLAIGIGEMRTVDPTTGIFDGDAIYKSGRKIAEYSTSGKERITIKNTLYYVSDNKQEDQIVNTLLSFVDVLLKKATIKQLQVLYYKLQDMKDPEIAEKLGLGVSTVNKHSTLMGWNAIAELLDLYENTIHAKNKEIC